IALVIVASSTAGGGEPRSGLRLVQVAVLSEHLRHVRGRDEGGPPLLVPARERPDAVRLSGGGELGRIPGTVKRTLVGALRAEDLKETVDVLDSRGSQDRESLLSAGIAWDPLRTRQVVGVTEHSADGLPIGH